MADNIFGERFLGARKPAWHDKGTVFTDSPSALEAIQRANCDFEVVKAPLMASVPAGMGNLQEAVAINDRFALMRQPTDDDPEWRFFGAVSNLYEVLQNTDIARALETLTDRWPVETVGALGDGETLFVALDAGEIKIAGEDVHQYFVFTDKKDGTAKARFMFTPVRVVCQNTLVMGWRSAQVQAEIAHMPGANHQVEFRIDVVNHLLKAQELSVEALQAMASVEITNRQAASIIAAAYPMPKRRGDALLLEDEEKTRKTFGDGALAEALFESARQKEKHYSYLEERSAGRRDYATLLFNKINDEYPAIANTPWAAYNAVVEAADYREGSGDIAQSALFGSRAKEKTMAYAAAMKATSRASK